MVWATGQGPARLALLSGDLTLETQLPLVAPQAGKPCPEGAAPGLQVHCPAALPPHPHRPPPRHGGTGCPRWLWLLCPLCQASSGQLREIGRGNATIPIE